MPITQHIVPLDGYYRGTSGNKLILNRLKHIDINDQEKLGKSLMTVYDNVDVISTVPRCDCGEIKGRYLLGVECNNCGSVCREVHDKVEPLIWLQALDDTLRFLNPGYWLLIREVLGAKADWLRWLCDSSYNPDSEVPVHIQGIYMDVLQSKRIYTNTMLHLKQILEYMINIPKFKECTKVEIEALIVMYNTYMEKGYLFSEYLPIVNKKLFVMENTSKGKFINLVVSDVMDVALTWIKSANSFEEDRNFKKAGMVTAMAVSELAEFFANFTENYILKKSGIFRKHIYGARSHFTFRSVIVSIPGPHRYDEIHIPWSIAVTVFRPMILNKLKTRGWSYKDMCRVMNMVVKKYDPYIDEILQELLREAPNGEIPVLVQRNPSLSQSSALMCNITKIGTDVDNKTIAVSQLVIKYPNGDYDG